MQLPQTDVIVLSSLVCGTIINSIFTGFNSRKLNQAQILQEKIHTLTNSAMGAQLVEKVEILKALSAFAHRFAESKLESDIEAAKAIDLRVLAAQKLYQDHLIQQAKVDAIGRL